MHCVEALFTEEKGLHEDVRLVEKTQTPKADDAEDWPAQTPKSDDAEDWPA